MQIHVYTDKNGRIVATSRSPQGVSKNGASVRIQPSSEHQIHEIELTDHLAGIKSASELHQELARLIKHKKQ